MKDPDQRIWIRPDLVPPTRAHHDRPVLDNVERGEFFEVRNEVDRVVAVVEKEDNVETVFRRDHVGREFRFPLFERVRLVSALVHVTQNHLHPVFLLKKINTLSMSNLFREKERTNIRYTLHTLNWVPRHRNREF